jgi:hypothetical protein
MTVEFIKTILDKQTGTPGGDASWSRILVAHRGDGRFYRVRELSTSSEDWDEPTQATYDALPAGASASRMARESRGGGRRYIAPQPHGPRCRAQKSSSDRSHAIGSALRFLPLATTRARAQTRVPHPRSDSGRDRDTHNLESTI